ncbi:CapA family protein [Chloroflexota bacterium]
MIYNSEKKDITMAFAGDVMLTRRLSVFKEERFLELRELLRGNEIAFANFESNAREYDEGSPTHAEGTFMTTEPKLLDDLKWLGINIVSCGNNHASDYGEEGVMATIRHLDAAGIIHSGIGKNLRRARSPAYLDTAEGRIALISSNSFFNKWSQASDQRPDFIGRPGVNPLGFQKSYIVDSQSIDDLKRIGAALGIESEKERIRNFGFLSVSETGGIDSEKEYNFLGHKFQIGDSFAIKTKANEKDVAENLCQLREARRQADWVIVSLHYHEMGGQSSLTARKRSELEECAAFIRDFAHLCVEEGAVTMVNEDC